MSQEPTASAGPGSPVIDDPTTITIMEMTEALLVFDEPLLNSRYHGMLARYEDGRMRAELVKLPAVVLEASRHARAGAERWMRSRTGLLDADFIQWGERSLMEAFLALAESQLRLIAYAARTAPTRESRAEFETAVDLHRKIAQTLRDALALLTPPPPEGIKADHVRGAQEEEGSGDIRGQLEATIRASAEAGHSVRHVTVSQAGLRHLRDQGAFAEDPTTILGTPVVVDFGWDFPAFSLHTFDAIPLEEMRRDAPPDRDV